jgi:hypothetical protein
VSTDDIVTRWLAALDVRHRSALDSREFLKAVRALSARYVERRDRLADRSPIDSDGKRAAFAAYYAPMHFFTVDALVRAAGLVSHPLETIVDLGCGTGVASAAWALALQVRPAIRGVDLLGWPLAEAKSTWRALGLAGRGTRGDLVEFARDRTRARALAGTGIVAGWSVNELSDDDRARLIGTLLDAAARGAMVVIIEPIGSRATPWWPAWRDAFVRAGGRENEWRLDLDLPPSLRTTQEAAGFPAAPAALKSLVLHAQAGS